MDHMVSSTLSIHGSLLQNYASAAETPLHGRRPKASEGLAGNVIEPIPKAIIYGEKKTLLSECKDVCGIIKIYIYIYMVEHIVGYTFHEMIKLVSDNS